MSESLTTLNGRYVLQHELGRGGAATVFAAKDGWLADRAVAIKLLHQSDPAIGERFQREASILLGVRHPHVASVYEYHRTTTAPMPGFPSDGAYLAMELCAGTAALAWAAGRPAPEVAEVGAKIAAALAALHAAGLHHGDVTPANIIIDANNEPRLIDFGLAGYGVSSDVGGTLRYMAPEAMGGFAGTPADIYGLAATLGAMLRGHAPAGPQGAVVNEGGFGDVLAAMSTPNAEMRLDAAAAFEALDAAAAKHDSRLRAATVRVDRNPDPSVGREIERWLDDVNGAHFCRRTVAGERGSGRTATLLEVQARAIGRGIETLGGVLSGASGHLDALAPALRQRGREFPAVGARDEWGGWSALAEALEGSSSLLLVDDVPPGSPLDRFAAFLGRLGNKAPPVLWVDSTRGRGGDLVLRPLDEREVGELIRRRRPLRPHYASFAAEAWGASDGLAARVVGLLEAHPGDSFAEAATNGTLRLPAQDVPAEIENLPAVARTLLSTIAQFSVPASSIVLAKLPKRWGEPCLEALEPLVDGGWVTVTESGGVVRFAPSPTTLRGALKRELSGEELDELVEASQDDPNLSADVGRWLERQGRKNSAEFLLRGARQRMADGRLDEAEALFRSVVLAGEGTKPQIARRELGALLQSRGRGGEALALLADRKEPEDRLARATLLTKLGRYDEAAEEAHFDSQDAPRGEALRARALMLAGRYDEAAQVATSALTRAPKHEDRNALRDVEAMVAFYQGNAPRARALLEDALAGTGDDDDHQGTLRAHLAVVMHKSGDLKAAETAYRASLESARRERDLPKQLLRQINLSTLLQERGRYTDALSGFREADDLARLLDDTRALRRVRMNWANLLGWLGLYSEGFELVDELRRHKEPKAELNAESAYLELVAGELLIGLEKLSDAEEALNAAAAGFGDSQRAGLAEVELLRAQLALRQRDRDRAATHAAKALRLARELERDSLEGNAGLWVLLTAPEHQVPSDEVTAAARRTLTVADSRGDSNLAWIARAALATRLAAGDDRDRVNAMLREARQAYDDVRSKLSSQQEEAYRSSWFRHELWMSLREKSRPLQGEATRDLDRLLAINRELAQDHDPDRLLERIIDAAIALSGAERGFLILVPDGQADPDEEDLEVRAARNLDRETMNQEELTISRSIALEAMSNRAPVSSVDAQGDQRFREALSVHTLKLRSVLCLPLRAHTGTLGALYLDNRYRVNAFNEADIALLSAFGDQAAIALANARMMSELNAKAVELERSRAAIEELNQKLESELDARNAELAHAKKSAPPSGDEDTPISRFGMVGRSAPMLKIFRIVERVADKNVPVSILGESGTGKELVARAIHEAGEGERGPFVAINCGAIPAQLLESELFGHEKGAFTGAVRSKPGLFEVASDGTLFLDEIGDMPLSMQVKLLRVLQQKEFRRVGGTENITTEARVISATHRDLEAMVREGSFREDLWYRLNVVEVRVPPLRERREDLPLLIDHLLAQTASGKALDRNARAALLDHDWPGNIRELENELQRATALADEVIVREDLSSKLLVAATGGDSSAPRAGDGDPLKQRVEAFERDAIKAMLQAAGGKVTKAAKSLGLTRAGLYKKINKYEIEIER